MWDIPDRFNYFRLDGIHRPVAVSPSTHPENESDLGDSVFDGLVISIFPCGFWVDDDRVHDLSLLVQKAINAPAISRTTLQVFTVLAVFI